MKEIATVERPFRCHTAIQMRFNDIDMLGHLNNTSYFEMFDLGKNDYFVKVKHDSTNTSRCSHSAHDLATRVSTCCSSWSIPRRERSSASARAFCATSMSRQAFRQPSATSGDKTSPPTKAGNRPTTKTKRPSNRHYCREQQYPKLVTRNPIPRK